MSGAVELPVWVALIVALLLLVGSGLTFLGTLGLLRLKGFYERVHAPTLGTTWGAGSILIASMIYFSVLGTRLAVHEILITACVLVTTPVTLMLLARAALYRDRVEASQDVPQRQSNSAAGTPRP
jgi:multicomponent K+:H+ antiporter subunit G